jgi:ABC-type Na+ efflux pump permease subunit
MVDTTDDFKVDEHFQNAPIDEEERLKAEKRAAKVKAKAEKEAGKEAKEEQVSQTTLFFLFFLLLIHFLYGNLSF